MTDGLLHRSLKKIGAVQGNEDVYRKGIDEGFQQGYWKAKADFENQINTLKAEIETMKVQYKVYEDQINLLGRLVGQLTEKQSGLTEETKSLLETISKLLNAPKVEGRDQ
ncbi:MAG: hypothetical protein FJ358_02845 [Thaumarchaeota archaeon]|nr:hypothetical protein [Nitrososphaerota archaeon]